VLREASKGGGGGGGGAVAPPAGRAFASGKTVALAGEATGGSAPPGFENTPGIEVKRGSAGAELPGKISFDIDPNAPKSGDRYTVKVFLLNEGSAPIQVSSMLVSTTINGKRISGPVTPAVRDVAPQQRALLMSTTELWKEDTSAWAMEVTVRTGRGERYTNQVSWK
jgi:hypothetical protein